jgi:hypothetical protein
VRPSDDRGARENRKRLVAASKAGRARTVRVNRERVLKWVEELREEQEKSAQEEARKEEILKMLGGIAKMAEHQRYLSEPPPRT